MKMEHPVPWVEMRGRQERATIIFLLGAMRDLYRYDMPISHADLTRAGNLGTTNSSTTHWRASAEYYVEAASWARCSCQRGPRGLVVDLKRVSIARHISNGGLLRPPHVFVYTVQYLAISLDAGLQYRRHPRANVSRPWGITPNIAFFHVSISRLL